LRTARAETVNMSKVFDHVPQECEPVETRYRRIHTRLPVPESIPILDRVERYETRSMLGQPPVVWDRAEGCQVFDRWGNAWLDWSSGVLVANAGHSHPRIRAAVREELERGLLFSYCFITDVRTRLAERLIELTPPGLDRVFFLTTGSETTENAIKLARTRGRNIRPEKLVVVSFEGAFHGRTMGAQQAGGDDAAKEWIGNLDPDFVQVPFPDGFRTVETSFGSFEAALEDMEVVPDRVCAVLMETYQGGGASFAPTEYVQELQRWCRVHDALLMMDEVQAGFGRTGRLFGFEHYGIVPDVVCLGKAISGSLPLSAVVGREDVMNQYGPGLMTSTHGGNPVACAAALANLDVLEGEGLVTNAARVGHCLREGLDALARDLPDVIGAVHGRGLVYGIHVVRPGGDAPNPVLAFEVVRESFYAGLLMFAPVGFGGATIKIAPSLSIPLDAIEEGLDVLTGAFRRALTRPDTQSPD